MIEADELLAILAIFCALFGVLLAAAGLYILGIIVITAGIGLAIASLSLD